MECRMWNAECGIDKPVARRIQRLAFCCRDLLVLLSKVVCPDHGPKVQRYASPGQRFSAAWPGAKGRLRRWIGLDLRGCDFFMCKFVVPPLGGIESERSVKIPAKAGTTNGASKQCMARTKKSQPLRPESGTCARFPKAMPWADIRLGLWPDVLSNSGCHVPRSRFYIPRSGFNIPHSVFPIPHCSVTSGAF